MSIEENLLEAQKLGLRCTAIYLDSNTKLWKAALRTQGGHYDYGQGKTPAEAMADCLSRAKGEQGPENRPHAPAPVKPDSIEDMF